MGAWWNDYSAVTSLNDADIIPVSQSNAQVTATIATLAAKMNICGSCILNSDSTLAGTPANTSETTLFTYTLPAGTLATDGHFAKIFAWGRFAQTTPNTKRVRLKLGSTTILDTTAHLWDGNTTTSLWVINATITRKAAGNQDTVSILEASPYGAGFEVGTPRRVNTFSETTENLNSALAITITGQNGTASASDIRYEGSLILLNS